MMGGDEVSMLRVRAEQLRSAAHDLDRAADALCMVGPIEGGEGKVVGGQHLISAVEEVVEPGETVHYRDICRRVLASGVTPRGKVPEDTLLAALNRSPYYSRVGSRSGEYRRNASAPEEASDRG